VANKKYIHGFTKKERQRLLDQGELLASLVYPGVELGKCRSILEVGSGVGAQTLQLLKRFPKAHVTCIEHSEEQLKTARLKLERPLREGRVTLIHASAERMPLKSKAFDGVFVCWLLEHVPAPVAVLKEIRRVLKKDGSLFIREVFNQLWYADPPNPKLTAYWQSFNDCQLKLGGDPYVGVKLGGLLKDVGFKEIEIEFRSQLFDRRDRVKRAAMMNYWRDLFLSGQNASPAMKKQIRTQFETLKKDPSGSLFFGFVAGQARM